MFSDFCNFMQTSPFLFSNLISIFREDAWKDYFPRRKLSSHIKVTADNELGSKDPNLYSGDIFVCLEQTLLECFGVIRNNMFIVYKQDSLLEVYDVLYLSGCYLTIDQEICRIFQYTNNKNPRIAFKSKSDISIEVWCEELKKAGDFKKFRDFYELGDRIGYGKFSEVHLAVEKSTNKNWAVKLMKRKGINSKEREMIYNEITILKLLDHKRIVKMKESFYNSTLTLLVEEYLEGESLLKSMKSLNELQMKSIIRQIADVLNYIHEFGIIHRDIKLENILFENSDRVNIKVIDFGLGSFIIPGKKHQGLCGTVGYTAPEMYSNNGYTQAVDMWSLGVVAYALLVHKLPFNGYNKDEIILATVQNEPDYTEFDKFSPETKEFVSNLLQKNPDLRLTAAEALCHPWLIV